MRQEWAQSPTERVLKTFILGQKLHHKPTTLRYPRIGCEYTLVIFNGARPVTDVVPGSDTVPIIRRVLHGNTLGDVNTMRTQVRKISRKRGTANSTS